MLRTMIRVIAAALVFWTSLAFAETGENSEPVDETPAVESPVEAAPSDTEARARFDAGELAYAAGRFEDALRDFRRAHELSGRDALLYNVGLAAERLRRDQEAVDAFARFLEASPNHPRASTIRERIVLLRAEIQLREDAEDADTEPPPPPQPPAAAPPSRTGPIVLAISGAILAAGGGALLALALADRNEVEKLQVARPWDELAPTVDAVPRRSAAGIALLATGGAAMVGALIWRLAVPAVEQEAQALEVGVSPTGVSLRGCF